MVQTPVEEFRALLVSRSPLTQALFSTFEYLGPAPLVVNAVPPPVHDISDQPGGLSSVNAVIVDATSDPIEAVDVCQNLQDGYPHLPLLILITCGRAVGTMHLQALVRTGAEGLLGPSATPRDILSALDRIARGQIIFQLDCSADPTLGEIFVTRAETNGAFVPAGTEAKLLQLVSRGMSDREIGERLHLSPPAVRRRIERLRSRTHTSNRTELAAWAGSHGFYAPPSDGNSLSAASLRQQ